MEKYRKRIVSFVLVLAMVLQVSPLSVLTINASESKEPIYTEKGIMYVYYEDISEYREDTLTYPEEEGYVFGGWWNDDQSASLGTEDVSGSAWAKYVPEDVLAVKAQVSERVADVIKEDGTLSDNTTLKLRLVTSVDDSEQYEEVGFKVKISKESQYKGHFYDTLTIREKNNTGTITPQTAFHAAASQFVTLVIGGIDTIEKINETELHVTPYWKTLDGTTVYAEARTRLLTSDDRSNDVDGSGTSGAEDFSVDNATYSFNVTAQSETTSYKYFEGASDTVYLKGLFTPSGENVKFGVIIRNGGQSRQILFDNAGVMLVNSLVSDANDTYTDVTNADGMYVWARKATATTVDSVTTYVATESAIMDLLTATEAKTVIWAIEENVLYCNIAGETVLRMPMELLCEHWKDGRYYQLGVSAYNETEQETNSMSFELQTLMFGKKVYREGNLITEGDVATSLNAMVYEPITGSYKAATQTEMAYAHGTSTTDAQLMTTTFQLPSGSTDITSSNGFYLKSGSVYATILFGGEDVGATIKIQTSSTNAYEISIEDWIEKATGITKYNTDEVNKATIGIMDDVLYLFINDKLAGSVDLYKMLSHFDSKKYYIEGSSSVQIGVCTVNSNDGNVSFKDCSLLTKQDAKTEIEAMLSDENMEVAREWELYANNSYQTVGKGYNMTADGYNHKVVTSRGTSANTNHCHIYGVPTTMPQKLTARLTSTAEASGNGVIVRYGNATSNTTTNYTYGINGFEQVFSGYNFTNGFSWGVADKSIYSETLDDVIYKVAEDGSYYYDITAVVKDGYVYISYNDELMFVDYLDGWKEGYAVRLGLYSNIASGAAVSSYENVSFEAGADAEVPQFMTTSDMSYDKTTGVYTPDASLSGVAYACSTATTPSQLMSTTISLPSESITSSNGIYVKSGDVYAMLLVDGTGTGMRLRINNEDSHTISIGNWISKAGITEYYKDGKCKLTAGIMDDTLYLFINDKMAGSVDLYKVLSLYSISAFYVEGSSTVQLGVCALNPVNGQVTFQDYSLTTGNEAEKELSTMISNSDTDLAREWEVFVYNDYHNLTKAYNGTVDGYEHTITAQYGINANSANCHIYGVPTTMPQKVEATITSTAETAGHGILVRYGDSSSMKNRIYGIHAGEDVFYGVAKYNSTKKDDTDFPQWQNRATITNQRYQEQFDEVIYIPTADGGYTFGITAIVKDGYLNVIYNGEVVFADYLVNWNEGDIVRLSLYTYCPSGEDATYYTNVSFEAGEDIEVSDIDREPADTELLSVLTGKKISILGDSISSYPNVSNGTMAATTNSTIENNPYWYNRDKKHLDSWTKTYWGRMIEKYEMSLCVNNSASSGWLTQDNGDTRPAGITRCVQLHDDTGEDAGTEPDIIAAYLGTNDLINSVEVGELTDDTYSSVKDAEGNYITPTTFTEGYIIMMDKMVERYKNADIFCFTLLPTSATANNTDLRSEYNARIRAIAEHYEATVVDIAENSGITNDNYKANFEGSHPLYQYIYKVSRVFENALKTKYCGK